MAAATASLLKASSFFVHRDLKPLPLKWRRNPALLQTTQTHLLLLPSIKKTITTTTGCFSMQCVMNNNSKNCFMEEEDDDDEEEEEEEEDDDEEEERKRNQNPLNKRFGEVMMLGGVMFLAYDPYSSAIAASGGRMGGQSFSSSSSSSSSRSSSPSSSSRSSSSSSRPSSSYSSCYYSDDGDDFYSSPSCFSCSVSSPIHHLYSFGESMSEWSSFYAVIVYVIVFIAICTSTVDAWKKGTSTSTLTNTHTTTVLKLQVGLMGKKRLLQRSLDRIAETADTSTNKGLSNILRDTTSLLLKHPACCVSGYSSVDVTQSIEDGEKLFNKLCIEERAKLDEETLVNVDNNKRQNTSSKGANGVSNEYIVITILVAAKGVHKLPAINGSADLKDALQKLGSISSNKTMAALEVLWTPQEENDTLTEQELHEDYPLLRLLDKDQDTQPLEKC